MAHGLEIYRSDGVAKLTIASRITRLISYHSGTIAANTTTSISVPGISTDGTWAVHLVGNTRYIELAITAGVVQVKNMRASVANSWAFVVFRY